jgi:small nuclear ribonucleoprotein (snRNP)-like protein
MDDAEEVYLKKDTKKKVGKILLRGDNVSLIMQS